MKTDNERLGCGCLRSDVVCDYHVASADMVTTLRILANRLSLATISKRGGGEHDADVLLARAIIRKAKGE